MRKELLDKINDVFDEYKSVNQQRIDECNFLKTEGYKVTINNGKKFIREKLVKGGNDGSASIILPLTKDGYFIIAIEPRVFTKKTVDIGFPAGYIEKNEDPVVAARRELLEETGYIAKDMIHLGAYYQDQGVSSAYNHYFLATDCKNISKQKLDKDENIKYMLVTYDELEYLFENNYIEGLNSAYIFEKAKDKIKKLWRN